MAKKWYLNMKKVDAADPHGPTVKLVAHRVEAGKFKRGSVKWSVKTKQSDQHVDFAAFDPKFNPETSDATDTKTFAHEFTFPEDISGVVYKFGVAPNSIITPNIKELAEEYETWKRVYFTLNYMAADSKALFDKAKPLVVKELARAGIELVEHESLKAGGPDEPMTLQGQDLAFVDRNKGDLTHAPYHIRVHMLRDIAGHEKNKKLTGVASAEAGDFQYVAQGEKLVLHTRAEQSKIDKFFSIDELVLTMGLDKETVPADKIKVRGATILVDLTPERLLALKGTSCAVKAKITGKAAETSSSALKLKITPTTTRELPAQDPDGKVGAWLDGDVLHIKTQAGWQVSAVLGIKGLVYGFGNKKSGGELSKTFYYEDEGKVVDDTSVTFDLSTSYVKTDGPNLAVPKHLRGSAAKRRAELEVELALWKAPKADAAEVTQDFSESADVTYAGGKMVLVTPLVLKAQGGVPDLKISALGSKMTLDKDQVRDCVQTPDDDEPTKDVTFELALDEGPTYASVLTALKAGWHVKVELTYSFTRSIGGYYSDSIGDKRTFVMTSISLKDDEPEEITVKRVAHAFLHEFSHALKLVKESETKKGNASDKNPLHYTGNGGQGPHCAWEVDKSKAGAYKPKPKEAGKKLCIMFHNLVPDRDGEFCPTCLGQLQRGSVKIPQT